MSRLAILAGAAALSLAASAMAAPADTGSFKQWRAACDNVGDCMALGFTEGEYAIGPYLVVRRENGPDAEAVFTFVLISDQVEVKEGDPVTLTVANIAKGYTFVADASMVDAAAKVDILGRDAPDLLAAILAGDTIEVEAQGRTIGAVSLSGSSAALRWIDDRQGRAGTVTALVARGPKPASAVPAARTAPVIALGPAIGQDDLPTAFPAALANRADVKACKEEQMDPEGDFGGPEAVARLTATEYLWAIPRGRGAYNFSSLMIVARADGSGARSPGLGGDDIFVNVGYDAENRTLSAFNKGRGLGDCGSDDAWAWDGRRFQRTRHAEMGDCRGVPSEDWLVTWSAGAR